MEEWNIGMMGIYKHEFLSFLPLFQHSIIPDLLNFGFPSIFEIYVRSRDICINSVTTGILGDIHRIVSGFNKPLQTEAILVLY